MSQSKESYTNLPPVYYSQSWDVYKRTDFDRICGQLEITEYYAKEFRHVAGRKIVFIIDNSGSMNLYLKNTSTIQLRPVRRYDELIEFIRIAVPILALDSPIGVDLWFLNPIQIPGTQTNMQYFPNIQAWSQIEHLFNIPPNGSTPMVDILTKCMTMYHSCIDEQGLLFLILTDGEPDEGPKALYKLIMQSHSPLKFIVNFRVCTDNDKDVEYLSKLDDKSPGVDVSDDYYTERKEVLKVRPNSKFGFNDYIMKCIIGGASQKLDSLDSKTFGVCTRCVLL